MEIETQKYIRKPIYVNAVRVTEENFEQIAEWCQGEIDTEVLGTGETKRFIKVRVHNPKHPRQTKAFVDDWLLYTERGYKVYTSKAFHASFDPVDPGPPQLSDVSSGDDQSPAEPGLQAAALKGGYPIDPDEPVLEETVEEETPDATEGKRVLSLEEQETMAPEEVQELIRSGEAVLAQELPEGVASE